MGQLVSDTTINFCAKCLVGHLHQSGLVVGMIDHSTEFRLLTTLLRRLQFMGTFKQQASHADCHIDIRSGAGSGSEQRLERQWLPIICGGWHAFGS